MTLSENLRALCLAFSQKIMQSIQLLHAVFRDWKSLGCFASKLDWETAEEEVF